jgi:hypothetical protein
MLSFSMPTIFASFWFWASIMAVIIAIHYFWGKTPPPAKPGKFFLKYKKTIYNLTDALIILFVVLFWLLMVIPSINTIRQALSDPEPVKAISLPFALSSFFTAIIDVLGLSGLLLGLLSIFHSNLAAIKRLILLFISLLPISFTILALLVCPAEDRWSTFKLGLISSFICWLINGPAIIIGKHFIVVSWMVMRALRLVSGEFPS